MADIAEKLRSWRRRMPANWYGNADLDAAANEIERLRRPRDAGVRECMTALYRMRNREAGMLDDAHSGQRGADRADALFDAHEELSKLLTEKTDNG